MPREAASALYQPPPGATAPVGRRGGASSARRSITASGDRTARSATAARHEQSLSDGGRHVRPCGSRRLDETDAELVELRLRDLGRRTAHRVEPRLVLRERDHVAQVRLAREHHRHAVDAERDPAVRRRAHGERVEQEAELRPLLVGAEREQVEDLRLDVRLVDPERAAAELVAVDDQVVGVRERVAGIVVERRPSTRRSVA